MNCVSAQRVPKSSKLKVRISPITSSAIVVSTKADTKAAVDRLALS